MKFSDSNEAWRPLPHWADFLIRLGYGWPESPEGRSRVCLVSMPCDSAAAGLIALGALVRDLANPRANDIDGHYDALLAYARQYVTACRDCASKCDPDAARCSFSSQVTGLLRRREGELYEIKRLATNTDVVPGGILCSRGREAALRKGMGDLRRDSRAITFGGRWVIPDYAVDWQIDGQPPAQLRPSDTELSGDFYSQLVPGVTVCADNRRASYSGLCYVGRAAGESASQEACATIRFQLAGGRVQPLPELLTINSWTRSKGISRMTFFNPRTERFDRESSHTRLVVADGAQSFLRALSTFQRSDVIGVMHRAVDRSVLEDVGGRMQHLQQWYEEDRDATQRIGDAPRGVVTLILRRRQA